MVSTVDGNLRGKKVAIFKNPKQYVQIWSCNEIILVWLVWITRWWFQIFFIFTPNYLGKISNLTVAYFQMGWFNHKHPTTDGPAKHLYFQPTFHAVSCGSHRLELMEIFPTRLGAVLCRAPEYVDGILEVFRFEKLGEWWRGWSCLFSILDINDRCFSMIFWMQLRGFDPFFRDYSQIFI